MPSKYIILNEAESELFDYNLSWEGLSMIAEGNHQFGIAQRDKNDNLSSKWMAGVRYSEYKQGIRSMIVIGIKWSEEATTIPLSAFVGVRNKLKDFFSRSELVILSTNIPLSSVPVNFSLLHTVDVEPQFTVFHEVVSRDFPRASRRPRKDLLLCAYKQQCYSAVYSRLPGNKKLKSSEIAKTHVIAMGATGARAGRSILEGTWRTGGTCKHLLKDPTTEIATLYTANGHNPVGAALLVKHVIDTIRVIEIPYIAVLPCHRGKGIGGELMSFLKDYAMSQLIDVIVADVSMSAVGWWDRIGFLREPKWDTPLGKFNSLIQSLDSNQLGFAMDYKTEKNMIPMFSHPGRISPTSKTNCLDGYVIRYDPPDNQLNNLSLKHSDYSSTTSDPPNSGMVATDNVLINSSQEMRTPLSAIDTNVGGRLPPQEDTTLKGSLQSCSLTKGQLLGDTPGELRILTLINDTHNTQTISSKEVSNGVEQCPSRADCQLSDTTKETIPSLIIKQSCDEMTSTNCVSSDGADLSDNKSNQKTSLSKLKRSREHNSDNQINVKPDTRPTSDGVNNICEPLHKIKRHHQETTSMTTTTSIDQNPVLYKRYQTVYNPCTTLSRVKVLNENNQKVLSVTLKLLSPEYYWYGWVWFLEKIPRMVSKKSHQSISEIRVTIEWSVVVESTLRDVYQLPGEFYKTSSVPPIVYSRITR